MTNETEIDTIVIDKVMKFWDLLFCDCCYIGICLTVFSTCVEVIPFCASLIAPAKSILHVCGGDPRGFDSF